MGHVTPRNGHRGGATRTPPALHVASGAHAGDRAPKLRRGRRRACCLPSPRQITALRGRDRATARPDDRSTIESAPRAAPRGGRGSLARSRESVATGRGRRARRARLTGRRAHRGVQHRRPLLTDARRRANGPRPTRSTSCSAAPAGAAARRRGSEPSGDEADDLAALAVTDLPNQEWYLEHKLSFTFSQVADIGALSARAAPARAAATADRKPDSITRPKTKIPVLSEPRSSKPLMHLPQEVRVTPASNPR